jgi:hypothetical protein
MRIIAPAFENKDSSFFKSADIYNVRVSRLKPEKPEKPEERKI